MTVAAMSSSPAGGVQYYLTSLKLAPHETRAIDIRQLRDAQVADFKKNRIPAGATDGAINWVRLDNVPVMGRVAVITKSGGIASSYDCCTTNCTPSLTDIGFNPTHMILGVGGTEQCWVYADYFDCNYMDYPSDVTAYASWSSNNTSVMTVTSSGDIQSVGAGNTYLEASLRGQTYDCSNLCQASLITVTNSALVVVVGISGPSYVPLRTGGSSGPNSMNLTATGTTSGGTYSWTTSSSKVSLTNTTSSTVTVIAVAASTSVGDVPITVKYSLNGVSGSSTGSITVVQPTSLEVETDTTDPTGHTCVSGSGTNTCSESYFQGSGTYSSYLRQRSYHIMDQFNPPRWIEGYSLQIQESFSAPTGTCAGSSIAIGNPSAGDTVPDCFYFCSATCQSNGSCSVSSTQTVTVNGFTVATKTVNWTCTGVSVSP